MVRPSKYIYWCVIGCISILFSIIFWNTYQHRFLIPWDEAAYAEWSSWTSDALRLHDYEKVLTLNLNHFDRPPLPTIIHGFSNILFNLDTIIVGRIISSVWFIATCLLLFLLSQKISTKKSNKTNAIVALTLFITSPMIIIFANIGMREMMGVALTVNTIYLYIQAYYSKKTIHWIFLSLGYALLLFTRYNYAIIVLIPILIEQIIRAVVTKTYLRRCAEIFIAIVPAWLLLFWYVYASGNTLLSFYAIFTTGVWNITGNIGTVIDHVFFYPKAIIYVYSLSPIIGILVLLGFFSSFRHWKIAHFRIGIILVILNILFGIKLSANLQERYIITIIPFLYVIAANEITSWVNMIPIHQKSKNIFLILFSICMISIPILRPADICSIGAYTLRYPLCNQPDFQDLIFSYDKTKWAKQLPPQEYQSPKDVYYWVAHTIDLSKSITFIGESNEFSQPYRNLLLEQFKKQNIPLHDSRYIEYIVAIIIKPTSPFYTRDYKIINEWKLNQLPQIQSDPTLTKIAEKTFEDIGVVAQVFGK